MRDRDLLLTPEKLLPDGSLWQYVEAAVCSAGADPDNSKCIAKKLVLPKVGPSSCAPGETKRDE